MLLQRVEVDPERVRDRRAWYYDIPAIRQLRDDGLDLTEPVTVIVGENGSGKSTFVEAVAQSWRSRLTAAVTHWGPPQASEDTDLHWTLRLQSSKPLAQGGCFLRAEAMHGLFGAIDTSDSGTRAFGGTLNTRSHGESFLAYLESRLTERGLFILDEPEAALSFTSSLRLLSLIGLITDAGSQVVLATHSPVLAAFPGADLLEFGEDGIHRREWQELELVTYWQGFLDRPQDYLRHLFTD